jgi:hypothetical protein
MVWGLSLWFAFAAVVFVFAVWAEPTVLGWFVWVCAVGAGVGWGCHVSLRRRMVRRFVGVVVCCMGNCLLFR